MDEEDLSKLEDFSSNISLYPLDETVRLDGEDVEDLSSCEDVEDLSEFITDDIGYGRNTEVFWDLVRCPIPTRANLKSVITSIGAALEELGLYGCVDITAYGGSMNHSKDDLRNAGILHEPQGELVADLILYARTSGEPLNLMVIPKPDPDSEMHRVLKCLQSRHHDVLLVNPEAPDGLFLSDSLSVQSVVECTQALDGGKPIIRGTRMGSTPVINGYERLDYLFSLFLRNSLRSSSCHGSVRNAFVFWDLVKCPIPTYANIKDVGNDIRAALQGLGNHGCVEILAFGGDKLNQRQKDLYYEARIIYIPQEVCEIQMAEALRRFRASCVPGTLMVIPKPEPGSQLHRVLEGTLKIIPKSEPGSQLHKFLVCLQSTHDDVLYVKPPDAKDSAQTSGILRSAHLIVGCTEGLYGGKPLTRGRRRMEDMHVIQDFSKRITFKKGETAGVFWNLEDFPFPAGAGWTPDDIYKKIESAFRDADYELSNMSIWAYVDDKEGSWGGNFLKNKTWKSSIYFLPGGGDKSARRNRMLHDIALWESDVFTCSHGFPATLVIVSDKDKVRADKVFSHRLRMMMWNQYNVWFLTPTLKADDSNWLTSVSEDVYTFPE